MSKQKIACSEITNQGWGKLARLRLPSGSKLGVYQPKHARPKAMKPRTVSNKETVSEKNTAKKAATKKTKSK